MKPDFTTPSFAEIRRIETEANRLRAEAFRAMVLRIVSLVAPRSRNPRADTSHNAA